MNTSDANKEFLATLKPGARSHLGAVLAAEFVIPVVLSRLPGMRTRQAEGG